MSMLASTPVAARDTGSRATLGRFRMLVARLSISAEVRAWMNVGSATSLD